jgi:hypothetical protein
MKTGAGGGNTEEGESIELFELPKDKIREFINDDSNPRAPGKKKYLFKPIKTNFLTVLKVLNFFKGLLYGLMWFLYEKDNYFKTK